MTGQETSNKPTDYWAALDIKKGDEYAILTNLIHQEWSGVSVAGYKHINGVVDTKNVDFGGDVVTLNQKRHVLKEDEYDQAVAEMLPFIRSALEFRPPEHGLLYSE